MKASMETVKKTVTDETSFWQRLFAFVRYLKVLLIGHRFQPFEL
jgi:hypothetical protein